ncbi:PhoH family protein [Acidihalobacter ferrooxydans]|uniref:PhoH-like protein n=1 Tax=Acidihalobacter ferrooxydans TaxID=1765967 RepID=A0A1P8UEM3_9GAMM|nr:PhoH family protein [Acidihalobacter ferrooxydans]APZ42305.1 phosphate starvation-inducible protein PhoH [Acidihalobacter ferrooxydans]
MDHVRASGVSEHPAHRQLTLEPASAERLASLCGQFDEHLRQIERRFGVEINNRGGHFNLIGEAAALDAAEAVLRRLYHVAGEQTITPAQVHLLIQEAGANALPEPDAESVQHVELRTRRGVIRGRGPRQMRYLHQIQTHDLAFGIGPAGTGKTYLAVASAVDALEREAVRRLVLVRPAVEAGERLGFLPGDLAQKVDPYLRPIYDALYEMLGFERVGKLLERNVIEVAPLAYMRGRTLNDAFVILDEAQNTTVEQMKMFLTRIGFGSTAVVTGDVSQIDLPHHVTSGLRQVSEVLRDVDGVSFTFFNAADVVRHPLVQRIVRAYEAFDAGSA